MGNRIEERLYSITDVKSSVFKHHQTLNYWSWSTWHIQKLCCCNIWYYHSMFV